MTTLDRSQIFSRGGVDLSLLTFHERLVFLLTKFETLMDMEGWDDFFTSRWSQYYPYIKEGLLIAGDCESIEVLEDYESHLRNLAVSLDAATLDAFLSVQSDEYFRSCRDWRDEYANLTEHRWRKLGSYFQLLGITLHP